MPQCLLMGEKLIFIVIKMVKKKIMTFTMNGKSIENH